MALMGAEGLRHVALSCNANTRALVDALTALPGVTQSFAAPFFHETVLQFDRPVAGVLEQLSANGILGGFDLSADYPELGNALLVCATEMRSAEDIQSYVSAAANVLGVAA